MEAEAEEVAEEAEAAVVVEGEDKRPRSAVVDICL